MTLLHPNFFALRAAIVLVTALLFLSGCSRTEASAQQDGAGADRLPEPSFTVEFRPVGDAETVHVLEVRSVLAGVQAKPDEPILSVPAQFANLTAQVYREGDVRARDDLGDLPLSVSVDAPQAGVAIRYRHFTAGRASRGAIEIGYRASVTPASAPRTLGPSYDLRGAGGGFLGGGASFLILPADQERRFRFVMTWDLSRIASGAVGVSTAGAGDVSFAGTAPQLMSAFFMGGRLNRYPEDAGNRPFNAFWIGTPNFDATEVMAWAERSYGAIGRFVSAPPQAPYYLLARPNPNPTIGGAATRNGFILEYGSNARDEDALKFMFTHEMIHHFITALDGPPMTTSWWHEGLAEFYKLRLPLREGLVDFHTYASTLRHMVDSYYRNPNLDLPNDRIAERFWADRSVQNLPYARGFMYFAEVDAKVRSASNGRRSLDDLVLAMLSNERSGSGYDKSGWRKLVSSELGTTGLSDFNAMMAGETLAPPAGAFGPCFLRRSVAIPRYSLGFSDPALQDEPSVRDLDPASAAARAGLREGDRVIRMEGWPVDSEEQGGGPAFVTVHVERQDTVTPILFDSAAGSLAGFTWIPKLDVEPARCAR